MLHKVDMHVCYTKQKINLACPNMKLCTSRNQLKGLWKLWKSRQILSVLIISKLSYFGKHNSWKMEALKIFGSWDQEIDSWFTNHEPLIPTLLKSLEIEIFTFFIHHKLGERNCFNACQFFENEKVNRGRE